MPRRAHNPDHASTAPPLPTASTPEERENQLIGLATDLIEKRLRDGSASSQETVHYAKLGSTREKLEQERLRRENILLEKKGNAIDAAQEMKQLLGDALNAFRSYAPTPAEQMGDDQDV
jgi:hypothetical protein